MKIIVTKTINISEENEALIPIVASTVGYEGGDLNVFISSFFKDREKEDLIRLIRPSVYEYFGGVMKDKAIEVDGSLQDAITVEVTIE